MTEPPLSRFAGQNPKPRPTDTIIVPGVDTVATIIAALLLEREIFTVEPSPTQNDVWHLGVFESGRDIAINVTVVMGH